MGLRRSGGILAQSGGAVASPGLLCGTHHPDYKTRSHPRALDGTTMGAHSPYMDLKGLE